jgi:hypothetical protein
MMFVPHRKHMNRPVDPVTEISLLLNGGEVRTSQEAHVWANDLLRGQLYF